MMTVNDFAFQFATFSVQNITCLDAGLDGKIQTAVNLVVPSPCETEPYNKYYLLTESDVITGKSQTEAWMY